MATYLRDSFEDICGQLSGMLCDQALIDRGEWQAQKTDMRVRELPNIMLQISVPSSMMALQNLVKPNLPWAEDHFLERVSGTPYNPPPSAKKWPFAQHNHDEHLDGNAQFSHTYPERYWPKHAADHSDSVIKGVRFEYGDLDDVAKLLLRSPGTRQAYLPVWFPEDTGAVQGQRVPCSLGYQFMLDRNKLDCTYMIRSCDFYRHFRDDVYMAARLLQWMAVQTERYPGDLIMHVINLHVFEPDTFQLTKDTERYQSRLNQKLWEAL